MLSSRRCLRLSTVVLVAVAVLATGSSSVASQDAGDFTLRATPVQQTVGPGIAASFTITVEPIGQFNSSVSLQIVPQSPFPSSGWRFDPDTVISSPGQPAESVLTFTIRDSAEATYPLKVEGSAGDLIRSVTMTLTVQAAATDFDVRFSSQSLIVPPLQAWTEEVAVRVVAIGDFSEEVELSVLSGSGRFTPSLDSTTLAPGQTTTLRIASPEVPDSISTWSIDVRATALGITRDYSIEIMVQPDINLSSGAKSVLFVPLRLPGASETRTLDDISSEFVEIQQYYREVSYGALDLTVDVADRWYDLPRDQAAYHANNPPIGPDALLAIDADVDLRDYDSFVFVVAGWTELAFATRFFGEIQTDDGLIYFRHALIGEFDGVLTTIHEMGHTLGLPDLYDLPPERAPTFVGHWDIMSGGSNPPRHFLAWSKVKLGWLNEMRIVTAERDETTRVVLDAIEAPSDGTQLLKIPIGETPPQTRPRSPAFHSNFETGPYLLLEARATIGFDSAIPQEGVLIYRVDETIPSTKGPLRLVDAMPETETLDDAAFLPARGEVLVFREPSLDLIIRISSAGEDQYDVVVDYAVDPALADQDGDESADEAETASLPLLAGSNLIGWIGGSTTTAALLDANLAITAIWLWDSAEQHWEGDSRDLPDPLRPNLAVEPGVGLFVIAASPTVIDVAPPDPGASTTLPTSPGTHLVGWLGEPTTTKVLLDNNQGIEAIWLWDSEGQIWVGDSGVLPAPLRPILAVDQGDGLIVIVGPLPDVCTDSTLRLDVVSPSLNAQGDGREIALTARGQLFADPAFDAEVFELTVNWYSRDIGNMQAPRIVATLTAQISPGEFLLEGATDPLDDGTYIIDVIARASFMGDTLIYQVKHPTPGGRCIP